MKIFDRMRRGWHLGITSLEILRDHPKLILFPLISGLTLSAVFLSIVGTIAGLAWQYNAGMEAFFQRLEQLNEVLLYGILFLFYLLSYFIILFFNVALIHNARLIFRGEAPSIKAGLRFSAERSHQIFAWSVLAATVGIVLNMLEERFGSLVSGILGFAWTLATYFVLPVIAYDGLGPVDALKASSRTIRERWGDAVGAGFSLGLFVFSGVVLAIVGGLAAGFVHPVMGVAIGISIFLLTLVVNGAARNIFLAAAYQHTQGNTPEGFDADTLDSVFVAKK
jgi:hypothetical protein